MDLAVLRERVFKMACNVSIGQIEKATGLNREELRRLASKELREGAKIKNGTGIKLNKTTDSVCLKCDKVIRTRELKICRNCKACKNYMNVL